MYGQRAGAQSYLAQQVMNDTPAARVALLYERALASLNEAIHAIGEGDVQRRCNANRRAIEIISVLSQTLDMERGGEIAQNLDRLYEFCFQQLQQVDLRNSAEAAKNVIGVLRPLHESWRTLAEGGGQARAQVQGGQSQGSQVQGSQAQPQEPAAEAPRPISLSLSA